MLSESIKKFIINLGLNTLKCKLDDNYDDMKIINEIITFSENEFESKFYNLDLSEEIDFDSLQEYINTKLLNDVKNYLFDTDTKNRELYKKLIISKATDYAAINNHNSKNIILVFIEDTLDIIKEFYIQKSNNSDKLLHNTTVERINDILNEKEEKILSKIDNHLAKNINQEPQLVDIRIKTSSEESGRKNEIEEIYNRLKKDNVVFIHGMGGIGKSELAKLYISKYGDLYSAIQVRTYYKNLYSTIIGLQFYSINDEDYGTNQDALYRKKLYELSRLNDTVLIVIDNFDEASLKNINDLISGKHKVIFTTRNIIRQYKKYYLDLKPMNEDYCLALFYKYYASSKRNTECNESIVKELIISIKSNTLMIILTALYCEYQRQSPVFILKKINENNMCELSGNIYHSAEREYEQNYNTVYGHIKTIFNLTFLSEKQQYILMNMSLIPFGGIRDNNFKKWCQLEDYDDINYLVDTGWIQKEEDNPNISLHPIISDLACNEFKPDFSKCKVFICELERLLKRAWHLRYNEAHEIKELAERIFNVIPISLEAIPLFRAINTVLSINSYCLLMKDIAKRLEELVNDSNEDSHDIAFAFEIIAISANHYGNNQDKVYIYYKKALDVLIKLKADDWRIASIHLSIAEILSIMGEHDTAKDHVVKAFNFIKSNNKITELELGRAHHVTSKVLIQMGDYPKSKYHAKKALKYLNRISDIEITSPMHVLGRVEMMLGNPDKGIEHLNKCLEIRTQFRGESHPWNYNVLKYLAEAYNMKRDYQKERYYAKKADEIAIKFPDFIGSYYIPK